MSLSRKPDLYRTVLHPALAIGVSTSAALTAIFLIARIAGGSEVRTATIVVIVLAPLIETIVGNLLYAERAGIGNRVRELLIYLILIYATFSLLRPGPLAGRFAPDTAQVLPGLSAGLTWLLAFGLHNRLRGRESLLASFHGKTGEKLRHALVDRQQDMALTVRELRRARGAVGTVFFFLCALTIVASSGLFPAATLPVSAPGFILLCISGVITAVSIGALNAYIDEYAANGVGLQVPLQFQRRRLLVGSIITLFAAAVAFALSRGESVLPLERIVAFFRWLSSLFYRDRPNVPLPPQPRVARPNYLDQLRALLAEAPPNVPPLWLRFLAQLLRRLLISVACAGVALLIFGPLFSPAFRAGLRKLRPGAALLALARRLLRRLRILSRWLRWWLRKGLWRRRSGSVDEELTDHKRSSGRAGKGGWRPSVLKRRQMDRVVSVFASITRWGADHGVGYRSSAGAREYLKQVAELFPEHYRETQTCARVFWEARYSRRTLSIREMREYVRAARQITATG